MKACIVRCKCGKDYKYFKNKPNNKQLVCPKCREEEKK
jgi:hypothetical protein